jgi:hypothetical protein
LKSLSLGPRPIYSKEQIEKAKKSPDFPREYEGKYIGLTGNLLSPVAIDRCLKLGEDMAKTAPLDNWDIETSYVMSIDIGWSTSATAIILSRFINDKVQIVYSREFERRTIFSDVINEIWQIKSKCGDKLKNIIIDASSAELYTTLCTEFDQNPSLKYLQDKQLWCKKVNTYLGNHLFIVPVAFGSSIHGVEDRLDKERTIHNDSFDSLLLNLSYYKWN